MSQQLYFDNFPIPKKTLTALPPGLPKKVELPTRRNFEPLTAMISICASHYTLFNDTSNLRRNKAINLAAKPVLIRKFNTGRMGHGVAKRCKGAISMLCAQSPEKRYTGVDDRGRVYFNKYKLGFITLTLSQNQFHDDKFIKAHLLKNFIDACRKRWSGFNYVWVSESQQINDVNNGRIHFHIATDHWIPKRYINGLWNGIQKRHGYLDNYFKKNGNYFAPSTKIEKARNEISVARYMRKYFAKSTDRRGSIDIQSNIDELVLKFENCNRIDEPALLNDLRKERKALHESHKRKIEGNLWGCSDNLKVDNFLIEEDIIGKAWPASLRCKKIIESEYYTVFEIGNFFEFIDSFAGELKQKMIDHFSKIFKDKVPPDIVYDTYNNYSY